MTPLRLIVSPSLSTPIVPAVSKLYDLLYFDYRGKTQGKLFR